MHAAPHTGPYTLFLRDRAEVNRMLSEVPNHRVATRYRSVEESQSCFGRRKKNTVSGRTRAGNSVGHGPG